MRCDVDVNSEDEGLRSLLLYAAENVNAKDKDDQSPLSYATKNRHSEVMQPFLGRSDVDINLKDEGLRSHSRLLPKMGTRR